MDLNRDYNLEELPIDLFLSNIKNDIVKALFAEKCIDQDYWFELSKLHYLDAGMDILSKEETCKLGYTGFDLVQLYFEHGCSYIQDVFNNELKCEVVDYWMKPTYIYIGDMEFEIPYKYIEEVLKELKNKQNE